MLLRRTAKSPRANRTRRNLVPSVRGIASWRFVFLLLLLAVLGGSIHADAQESDRPLDGRDGRPLDGRDGRPLALSNFRPQPQLVAPSTDVVRAKFPVIDVHVHPRLRFKHVPELLDQFVTVMDQQNVAVCVSLDGRLGDQLAEHQQYLSKYKDRFAVFANIDWQGDGQRDDPASWACHRPGFGRRMADALADAKSRGAVGLKVFKMLGLYYKNPDGSLIAIDDPRWDPIWQACGELGLPVIIHSADPVAFFDPVDERNERWEELSRHPNWSFADSKFPRHDELLAARNRVIARHSNTTFIGAHVANYPENLPEVARWLDAYPNLVVEISSRIAELGRQPRAARQFFVDYQDRIMFGSDGPRPAARLRPQWRFLETDDEYFPYAENPFPPQGLWNIYGIHLPDQVLRKVYHENALRVIPGLGEKFANYQAE